MLKLTEVIGQVQAWLDHLYAYGDITERSMRRLRDAPAVEAFARTLQEGNRARLGVHEFWIANFRELNGRESPMVIAANRGIRCPRTVRVFVGHRFTPAVTRNLRHNLQVVLRPYGIKPVYSDSDMPNGPVFETILERIRAADFSIEQSSFDWISPVRFAIALFTSRLDVAGSGHSGGYTESGQHPPQQDEVPRQ